jgi:fructuronate reductase
MEELLGRFANPRIGHLSSTVGSDGSLKLPMRITGPVCFHARPGRVPRYIALTIAAYIRCLAVPGSYDQAALGQLRDPAARRMAALGARNGGGPRLAEVVFAASGLFASELGEQAPFVAAVGELLDVLDHHGVAAAIAATQG